MGLAGVRCLKKVFCFQEKQLEASCRYIGCICEWAIDLGTSFPDVWFQKESSTNKIPRRFR